MRVHKSVRLFVRSQEERQQQQQQLHHSSPRLPAIAKCDSSNVEKRGEGENVKGGRFIIDGNNNNTNAISGGGQTREMEEKRAAETISDDGPANQRLIATFIKHYCRSHQANDELMRRTERERGEEGGFSHCLLSPSHEAIRA